MLLLKFRVLASLLTSHVSCLSPWTRQNFPASLKIEQTLSTRSENQTAAGAGGLDIIRGKK